LYDVAILNNLLSIGEADLLFGLVSAKMFGDGPCP